MKIEHLKIANIDHHEYFVQTVYKLLSKLGFEYSYNEIEEMSIENGYCLYLHDKKTKKWHLGIWAVGEWGIKEKIDGKQIAAGYGIENYEPLTISVFLIHDWTYDKFRPSRADSEMLIKYNENYSNIIEEVKYVFKHPITSYYNLVEKKSFDFKESNKYLVYLKAWYFSVYCHHIRNMKRRIMGYIATKFFMLKSFFDKRVAHREYKFHKDEWNKEYELAIVFKYGETEWDDWKAWFDYKTLFEKLYRWNIWINFNYLDEEGNMPTNIWRGVYWDGEPDKE